MRLLFFILLLPFASFGQEDILNLSFEEESTSMTSAHLKVFEDFVRDKSIFKLSVTAYVGSTVSVSKNRTRVEKRLISLKNACAAQNISTQKIKVLYEIIQDENKFNLMILNLSYKALPGTGVVYHTNKVEITEAYPTRTTKTKKPETVAKKVIEKKVVEKSAKQKRVESRLKKDSTKRAQQLAKKEAENFKKPLKKDNGLLKAAQFKKGAQIVIPKLIFYATRHKLERSSIPSLKTLLAIMREKPSLVIRLEGHICCKADGEDGLDFDTGTGNLSENRARVVHDFLIANGISPKRLSYVGYGSKYKRVQDNGNAIEGKENRRVEIFVISE